MEVADPPVGLGGPSSGVLAAWSHGIHHHPEALVINWIKNRLAKILIALVQCVLVALVPFSASASAAPITYNITSITVDGYSVPYQMNIVLFEQMLGTDVLDLYLTTGKCTNKTVGSSTLIQHNVPNHNNVQFNLPAFGTYCYYAVITHNGVAQKPDELLTIDLVKQKPPRTITPR